MFKQLLHSIVARPWVYDMVQYAVGAKQVRRRLAQRVKPYQSASIVIDIGGGTGATRAMWSPTTKYVCLDIDPLKLEGYVANNPDGLALLADATNIPVATGAIDAVVCTSVTHHLPDVMFEMMLTEAARVLRDGTGRLILLDALMEHRKRAGRLLWKYDRGTYPRTGAEIKAAIARHFEIELWEEFSVWHAYAVVVARPRKN